MPKKENEPVAPAPVPEAPTPKTEDGPNSNGLVNGRVLYKAPEKPERETVNPRNPRHRTQKREEAAERMRAASQEAKGK